jgi:hypothetical protein
MRVTVSVMWKVMVIRKLRVCEGVVSDQTFCAEPIWERTSLHQRPKDLPFILATAISNDRG